MDEFLVQAAFILGVTPKQLEHEYYMVDIPKLIEKQREKESIDRLIHLRLLIASNSRLMEDNDYSQFVNMLSTEKKLDKFDRNAMERLRSMSR